MPPAIKRGRLMFDRIARGWRIMKASGGILARHPKLVILPLLSFLSVIALTAAILIPLAAASGDVHTFFSSIRSDDPLVYASLFAFYFVCTFFVVLFNAALVFCALESFAGRTPSIAGGLAAAFGRLPQILAWTFVATTVGILLNALQ